MQAERCYVGADVAKAEFVVGSYGPKQVASKSVPNSLTAIGRWLRHYLRTVVSRWNRRVDTTNR